MLSPTTPTGEPLHRRFVAHHDWLSQGDLFASIPIGWIGVENSAPVQKIDRGPALLVTAGCVIDKKTRAGRSSLEYLTFLPLRNLAQFDASKAGDARRSADELRPYGVLYVGFMGDSEYVAPLAQPFTFPALLLRPDLVEYEESATGEPDIRGSNTRLRPTVNDTRVGRLHPQILQLFLSKWAAFFLGFEPVFPEGSD